MNDQLAVALVFLSVFVGIVLEKIDKTVVVLTGALFLVLTRYLSFEQAIEAVDYHTIALLLGMMIVVVCLNELQLFRWLALRLALLTRGNPVRIFVTFGLVTAILSAFLDNVTTVLVIVPLLIALTAGIGLDSRPYILFAIFMSNVGGTSTLIGDPPNLMIGSQAGLPFAKFPQYLLAPVVACVVMTLIWLRATHRTEIASRNKSFGWLFMSNLTLEQFRTELDELRIPKAVIIKATVTCGLVLVGFFTHTLTGIEASVVALVGAVILLAVFHDRLNLHHIIAHVEWPTLLFFTGLFVVVGAVEHVGILKTIAGWLISLSDNLWVLIMIVLWASAMLSAIVDNIPFVAVMIPVIKELQASEAFAQHPGAQLLWWALSLGACLGGNATSIGASANVVALAIARTRGVEIGFRAYAREAVWITLGMIVICSVYLSVLYWI